MGALMMWGMRGAFAVRIARPWGISPFVKRPKELAQGAKTLKVGLGKLVEKVRERGVAVLANETAPNVVGNAPKRLAGTGINGGGKAFITPHTTAQRRAEGWVVDVFVLLTVRHRKIPLDNDLLSAYAKEDRAVKGCMGDDSIVLL